MQQTFRELAHRWAEAKQPIVKYSTICAYRLALRTHLIPRFGSMVQIHEAEVQEFIVDKMRAGMAKKTVRDIVAVLRAVVRYGARLHLCERENWQLAYPTTEQGRKLPVLSLAHQRKLMQYLVGQPTSRNIGILLALCTGMRIGEVCALEWGDVSLQHRTLRVRQTVGRIYDCERRVTERVFSTPKTKHSFREIPISKLLFDALCSVKRQGSSRFVVGVSEQATFFPFAPALTDSPDCFSWTSPHLCDALHREPVRLQDGEYSTRPFRRFYYTESVRSSQFGSEAPLH